MKAKRIVTLLLAAVLVFSEITPVMAADSEPQVITFETSETETKESETKESGSETSEAKEPEVKESETKETEAKEPENKDAEAKEPETKEPETKEPETKEAETKEPETKETETKEPETKETETKEPETKESETKEAETKGSETNGSETKEPENKGSETKEAQPSAVYSKAYLALGADLSKEQLAVVLNLLGISASELEKYNVVYVTNAEEHAGLDVYISPELIGKKSLSSVLVRPAADGYGVVVHTHNINYCTDNMYRNALITAGVQNADITVAAPTPVSGTAALIGALKAYENMSGKSVPSNTIDAALNELVTTSELSDTLSSSADAEELISYIKAQIAANDLDTREEIDAAIRKGMQEFNADLSEEDIKSIVDLMMKIKDMGIGFDVLADQAEDIYAKYKDQIDAGTFDIKDVKVEDLGLGKLVVNAASNFFKEVTQSVKGFFSGLFSKKK